MMTSKGFAAKPIGRLVLVAGSGGPRLGVGLGLFELAA